MKTIQIKKAMQVITVTAIIISSFVITKNIINNVKYLYSLQPAGIGLSCFYDMMQ